MGVIKLLNAYGFRGCFLIPRLGGVLSSPLSHGFDLMNATVEVAPTATTNCECNAEWQQNCDFGHYDKMTHCSGAQGPDSNASRGCCFNYWWGDEGNTHGVTNLTKPSPDDDATYNAEAFVNFVEARNGVRSPPCLLDEAARKRVPHILFIRCCH